MFSTQSLLLILALGWSGAAPAPEVLQLRLAPPRVELELRMPEASPRNAVMIFVLYREREDAVPAWSSSQTVTYRRDGRLRVVLGLGSATTLPAALFDRCSTRWLQIEGARPTPRIPLRAPCPNRE